MNQRQIIYTIVLLVVLAALGALSGRYAQTLPQASSLGTTPTPTATQVASITYQGEDGRSVLELLERNHKAEVRDSSFGRFVVTIDGIAGTPNAAWLYYVDGQQGTDSVDTVITTNGQTIEWRYESF